MLRKTLITVMVMMSTNSVYADMNNTVPKLTGNISKKPTFTVTYNKVIVYARSSKKSYVTGEPIGIELRLGKDSFIYFWSVGKDRKPHLILPNDFESYNAYKKNIAYSVPEVSADYSFVSNRVGVEEVYVLASPEKLTKDTVKEIMYKQATVKALEEKKVSKDIHKHQGIVVVKRKPSYEIKKFKIIVYGNSKEFIEDKVVKIAPNPYGKE